MDPCYLFAVLRAACSGVQDAHIVCICACESDASCILRTQRAGCCTRNRLELPCSIFTPIRIATETFSRQHLEFFACNTCQKRAVSSGQLRQVGELCHIGFVTKVFSSCFFFVNPLCEFLSRNCNKVDCKPQQQHSWRHQLHCFEGQQCLK